MPKKLLKVVDSINKRHGAGTILRGSEMQFKRVPRVSTGIFSLDVETGGGWPRGRIHHVYGPYSAGKSFIAYMAAAEAQKHCMWCSELLAKCTCGAKDPIVTAWLDVENTDDPNWRKQLGVDPELFYPVRVEYGEQAIDITDALIRSGEVGLVVYDSVAATTRSEQVEKSAEENQSPASLARLFTLATRKWQAALNTRQPHPVQMVMEAGAEGKKAKEVPKLWDNLTTVICLNQIRDVINSQYPQPPGPPGGHALRHAASIELRLSFGNKDMEWSEETADGEQAALSQTVHFITQKNKTYPPKRSGNFNIDFHNGRVNNEWSVYQYAKRWGIVQVNGSWFNFHDAKVQGEDAAYEKFTAEKFYPQLLAEVQTKLENTLKAIELKSPPEEENALEVPAKKTAKGAKAK